MPPISRDGRQPAVLKAQAAAIRPRFESDAFDMTRPFERGKIEFEAPPAKVSPEKPVPPEVLKDYPELARGAESATLPPVTPKKGTANISAKDKPQAEAGKKIPTLEEYIYGDNQLSKLTPEKWKEQFGDIPYRKDGTIKIYRGAFLKERYGIKEGDWVTLDKNFAKENYAGKNGKVFEKEVPIDELMLNIGTSQPGKSELIWKPEVSLETYDSNGKYEKLADKYNRLYPNPSLPPEVGGQYSIRTPQNPPASSDPKVLNLYLKDETDAIVQTIMNKLHPKSMTWLETMLKSPEWFDHPQINNIVRLFIRDRNELRHETFNDLNAVDDINATEKTVTEAGLALKNKGLSLAKRMI